MLSPTDKPTPSRSDNNRGLSASAAAEPAVWWRWNETAWPACTDANADIHSTLWSNDPDASSDVVASLRCTVALSFVKQQPGVTSLHTAKHQHHLCIRYYSSVQGHWSPLSTMHIFVPLAQRSQSIDVLLIVLFLTYSAAVMHRRHWNTMVLGFHRDHRDAAGRIWCSLCLISVLKLLFLTCS